MRFPSQTSLCKIEVCLGVLATLVASLPNIPGWLRAWIILGGVACAIAWTSIYYNTKDRDW